MDGARPKMSETTNVAAHTVWFSRAAAASPAGYSAYKSRLLSLPSPSSLPLLRAHLQQGYWLVSNLSPPAPDRADAPPSPALLLVSQAARPSFNSIPSKDHNPRCVSPPSSRPCSPPRPSRPRSPRPAPGKRPVPPLPFTPNLGLAHHSSRSWTREAETDLLARDREPRPRPGPGPPGPRPPRPAGPRPQPGRPRPHHHRRAAGVDVEELVRRVVTELYELD